MAQAYTGRETHLEGMRGVAALMVVAYHSIRGFLPALAEPTQGSDGFTLAGTPLWAFVNGPCAVVFFFLLSGYVLTRTPLATGDGRGVVEGVVKRWPRLAGPVVVAVLLAWAFLMMGLDMKSEAALVTKSTWILYGGVSSSVEPSFYKAFLEGAFFTFFRGDQTYNASLWTMRIEMVGSLVAYALCLFLLGLPSRGPLPAFVLLVAAILCHYANPNYVAFVAGVAYARYRPPACGWRIGAGTSAAMLATAVILGGYVARAGGIYGAADAVLGRVDPVYVYLAASFLTLLAADANPSAARLFSGRIGAYLGWVSFPIYLIHTVVLCSAGAATAVILKDFGTGGAFAAIVVTLWLSLVAAYPLAAFNDAWLRLVNAVTRRLMAGRSREGFASRSAAVA